jgi:hypothetical protein
MKSSIKKITLLGAMTSIIGSGFAQQAVLDVNQIRTNVLPLNSLFWDQQQFPSYEVPKGSGKHSMYVGNLWFMGKDSVTDSLHGFAERYRTAGPDTWTGPLKVDGSESTTMATVLNFGRVWKLNRIDIDALIQAQSNGTLASGTYTPPVDILQWPGNGPAGYAQNLSPFHDNNSDGIYNIYDGDYPLMKGEQMLYWILNDSYGVHNETNMEAMGAEIHISFYACKNNSAVGNQDIINYTTFLEYEIINRSLKTYEDVYAGFNTDADIGYSADDYTGSHVDADAFYFYNGDAIDAQGTIPGPGQYGIDWPVQSIQFLEGKEVNGRTMSRYMYYENNPGVTGDPEIGKGIQYYNYLRGFWKNNQRMVFGSTGFPGSLGATTIEANYMFPGVSDPANEGTTFVNPGFEWSQPDPCPTCPQSAPRDVRGVGVTGPFTLSPGASMKVVLGLISTFDSTSTMEERVELNRTQNKTLRQWYDGNAFPCVMDQLSNEEFTLAALELYPNPANNLLRITGEALATNMEYRLLDMNGRVLSAGKSPQDKYMELDVAAFSPGLYFVQLKNKDGRMLTLKFVKN